MVTQDVRCGREVSGDTRSAVQQTD
jgi:hypothetical protein